jgi:ABC-type dipeptide/oligopeptide/nickel transport system permease component
VIQLLAERAPATLELALISSFLSLAIGIPMGVYTALRRDSLFARVFQSISLVGVSLPTFLIGILLIYLFAVTLGWLPSFGRGQTVVLGGIMETEQRESERKVPFLGDVPAVGRLFKTTTRVNNKKELLIFVTPKILREGASLY